MRIDIRRKRWVIVRDGEEIFCGLARSFQFKKPEEIGDTAVKTYLSEKKAIAAFNASWHETYDGNRYKAVEVVELLKCGAMSKRTYADYIREMSNEELCELLLIGGGPCHFCRPEDRGFFFSGGKVCSIEGCKNATRNFLSQPVEGGHDG